MALADVIGRFDTPGVIYCTRFSRHLGPIGGLGVM